MKYFSRHYLAPLLLLFLLPLSVPGQERALGPSEKQIRARKLATQWVGLKVVFILESGEVVKGRPIRANFNTITLSVNGTRSALQTDDINAIILKPGLPEILLSGVAGILGGALGYGAVQLAVPTASTGDIQIGAATVSIISMIWGIRTFFREIRYDLEGT